MHKLNVFLYMSNKHNGIFKKTIIASKISNIPKNILKKIFFNVYLFLRERVRHSMSRGGPEREGDTESEAGSRL